MGSFSWLKADTLTDVVNIAYGHPFKCLIPAEFGGGFVEDVYQDYGYLGTKEDGSPKYDMYELLAFWNADEKRPYYIFPVREYLDWEGKFPRREVEQLPFMKEIDQYTDHNRGIGIDIGCYDQQMRKLKYPLKLVSVNYNGTYEQCSGISYSDPEQGFSPVLREDFLNYRDKNGILIRYGVWLIDPEGKEYKVEETSWQDGKKDLGICITNPDFLKNHPYAELEYSSLSQFDLSEWQIHPYKYF